MTVEIALAALLGALLGGIGGIRLGVRWARQELAEDIRLAETARQAKLEEQRQRAIAEATKARRGRP